MIDDDDIGPAFLRECGPDPAALYRRLRDSLPEFETQAEFKPEVGFLFRRDPLIRNERRTLGTVYCDITVNGAQRDLFEWLLAREFGGAIPVFVVILEAAYWREGSDLHREILMHHEMSHIVQKTDQHGAPKFSKDTGEPIWGIRGHDVEEFVQVVQRYGAHTEELRDLVRAAAGGREIDSQLSGKTGATSLRLVSKG